MPDPLATSNDSDRRPTKKRALSPTSRQAASVSALFANPAAALRATESKSHTPSLPPEIVTNVQGSSAGAGSGEFFVYKAARRREYERLAAMDAESQAEKAEEEYEKAREERRAKDEAKTGKNRARREKAKMRKEKKATGTDGALDGGGGEARKKLKANALPANAGGGDGTGTGAGEKEEIKVVEEQGITIHED